jgi:hypothetical protein
MTTSANVTETRDLLQENLNTAFDLNKVTKHDVEHLAKTDAEAFHAPYPQYKDYFTNWRLVRVYRQVDVKGGTAFEDGDLTIGFYRESVCYGFPGIWLLWSIRLQRVMQVSYAAEYVN